MLNKVSLTGPDDRTPIAALNALGARFPFVEWALLYVAHNEGAPRNPTQAWREAFFDAAPAGHSAVHLCGSLAFQQLLAGSLPREILRAKRLQLNVNARRRELTDAEVLAVYGRALDLGPDIILQRHADTAKLIAAFVARLPPADRSRVHVLLDESKGTGKSPQVWSRPAGLDGLYCGFAGGLGPANIAGVLPVLDALGAPCWADMESGVRTDNEFDLEKARQVLAACEAHLKNDP